MFGIGLTFISTLLLVSIVWRISTNQRLGEVVCCHWWLSSTAPSSQEIAAQIYTASLLAVNVDTAAEKGYLTMLVARLRLPSATYHGT
jgi:hypothetical protein